MTAGGYGYGSGSMRATDTDRESVRTMLQDAHAQGRLSWEEFDSRSSALVRAQTYDELAVLTADLSNRIPSTQPQVFGDYQGGQGGGYQQGGYQQGGYQGAGYQQGGYQGAGYQQAGYQQGAGFGGGPFGPVIPTNSMAIASLICGVLQLFFWVLTGIPAIILGHMARKQIRQSGEQGAGMALAGMILGYVGLVFAALFTLLIVIVAVAASHNNGFSTSP